MPAEYATELLSRIQFAFTIGFHIIFPTLNVGLGLFLAIMEGLWLKTHLKVYYKTCRFWAKIFALTFGMGVVSGVALHYEIGTNFSAMTHQIGGVLGPLFSYEVMTAFFLESGFLGIMLFGWHRVGHKLHFAATCLVAIGTIISAFWIMSANSWMQTPAGASLGSDGIYHVTSWLEVIFNPSAAARFWHMLLASLVTTTFVIGGVSAWYILKQRHLSMATLSLRFVMSCALILVPGQIIVGDLVGLNVYHYQPLKTAAMEGNWHTQKGAPLVLFAIPDQKNATNHYEVSIPKLASFINTHDMDGELIGLDSADKSLWPIVPGVFYSFRIMVGIGLLFLAITLASLYLRLRKKRFADSPWFLKSVIFAAPMGFIATITGWMVAELGRQPWVAYGLIKTHDIITPIAPAMVKGSLAAFVIVYTLVAAAYAFYLTHLIKQGPVALKDIPPTLGYMDHAVDTQLYQHSDHEEKHLP
jgi:cytochrome bd ubiquinol oxidase subunit I